MIIKLFVLVLFESVLADFLFSHPFLPNFYSGRCSFQSILNFGIYFLFFNIGNVREKTLLLLVMHTIEDQNEEKGIKRRERVICRRIENLH